jgi:hypothetical protein
MLHALLFCSVYITGVFHSIGRNPASAFMLYQVVYFMYPQGRWWGYIVPDVSYSFFTVLLMFAVFALGFEKHSKNGLLKVPQFKWVFLVCVLFLIAGFYAVLPDIHQTGAIYFLKLVLIISVAFKLIDSIMKLNGVLYAYIAGAAYVGFLTYQTGRNSGDRVEGIGTIDSPDSNGIAAGIAPSALLALNYLWTSRDRKLQIIMVVAGALIANALVLINSRGAFLATIIGAVYFFGHLFFSKQQRKNQKRNSVVFLLFIMFAALMIIDTSAIERLKSVGNTEVETEDGVAKESGATRVFFWIAAIDAANDYPYGLGFRGFEAKAPEYIPEEVDTGKIRNRSVHSTWFQALTEIGYLGLFAFFMMLLSCFRSTKKCKKLLLAPENFDDYFKVVAIESALLTHMVAMSFMNRLTGEILYWLVMFTACAYNIYVLKLEKTVKAA